MKTYGVLCQVVSPDVVDRALRVINLDVRFRGLYPAELQQWYRAACPFPHLRFSSKIATLHGPILARLGLEPESGGQLCEPQIIYHLPDDVPADYQPWSHIDQEPKWANGRKYIRLAGLALTDWTEANGTLQVWESNRPRPVELRAGDAVVMQPDTPHSAGINRSGQIRAGVYFRWLQV